jgi:hypothetical protein
MKTFFSFCAAVLIFTAAKLDAAQVTWGAYTDNGIGTAEGAPLDIGDLARIGTFNIDAATIRANAGNISFLEANFVQFGLSTIGTGTALPGYWFIETVNSANALNLNGDQIYYWIFDGATVAASTQHGIFTAPGNPSWLFPNDADIPPITGTDLTDVPTDLTGIIIGGFGTGSSQGFPLYNLAVIPEPSTYALLLIGAGAVAYIRRRAARS